MSSPARLLAPLALVVVVVVGVGFAMDGGDDPQVRTSGGDPTAEPITGATETDRTSAPDEAGAVPGWSSMAPPDSSAAPETSPAVAPGCTIDRVVRPGDTDAQVACLESVLAATGLLAATPDESYDDVAVAAVEAFQSERGLEVDGIVGPATAAALGTWDVDTPFPPDARTCSAEGRSAVVDRRNQRAWLCANGAITREMPITSAVSQPDPGTYQVYAKDLNAASTISGSYTEMTHFVAFTYGKYQGARIAFHSVPTYPGGGYVQPLESVGTPELFGASSGCIRVLPDDAVAVWDWLAAGDDVIVIS
jgi:L,D-transpeptidase catalytic domain/Putative peptidoglycan binding domain